jgi:hypothetical protein
MSDSLSAGAADPPSLRGARSDFPARGTRAVAAWIACAGLMIAAPARAQPAAGDDHLAKLPRVALSAVVCSPGSGDTGGQRGELQRILGQPAAWQVSVATGHAACEAGSALPPSVPAPDLVAHLSAPPAGELSQAEGGPQVEGGPGPPAAGLLTRIRFRPPVDGLEISIQGRKFMGRLATTTLEFPAADDRFAAPAAPDVDSLSSPTPSVAEPRGPAAQALLGLLHLLGSEKLAVVGDPQQTAAALVQLRARALQLLAAADRPALSDLAPATAASLKQLRALLLLRGACNDETPAALLRTAARLVPHDANARALAAVGQLRESYETSHCVAAAENELVQALALDPWNPLTVASLGVFYELARNAPPSTTQAARDTARLADQRLQAVWKDRAPVAPMAIELGIGAGVMRSSQRYLLTSLAPAGRFELTLARDASGWGARLGAGLPWTRQVQLADGFYSWTRLSLAAGGRYRIRLGNVFGEMGMNLVLAPVWAQGHGFAPDRSAAGLDIGAENQLRVGRRVGPLSLWLGAGAGYFFGRHLDWWPSLDVHVDRLNERGDLPALDLSLLAGFSTFFWTGS